MSGRSAVAVAVLLALAASPAVRAGCSPIPDPIPGNIPAGPFTVRLQDEVSTLVYPIDVAAPDDGSGRLFVTLREGKVVIVQGGTILSPPFLDISSTTVIDAGSAMSSIALHPGFTEAGGPGEGMLYTISQEATGTAPAHFGADDVVAHQSVVYGWTVSDTDPDLVDPASRTEILRFNERTTVHNVDELAFGPDGYLYITKGDDDSTSAAVLDGTIDDGAIFRIDVDDPGGNGRYSIPGDNPFVGNGEGKIEEIWAYGFRNPWRAGFDRNNGVMYVADIGEDDIEEIDVIEPGRYYGWIDKEGSFVFLDFSGVTDDLSCLPGGFESTDPIAEYDHSEGDRSITGGFVYRGTLMPELVGHYVFGDWSSGRLFHMAPNVGVIRELAIDPSGDQLDMGLIGISEDSGGELLIVVSATNFNPTGRLIRVVGLTSDPAGPPPGVPGGGAAGSAMTAAKLDPAGVDLAIDWDSVTCADARGYQIVYGWGSDLPPSRGAPFAVGGGRCDVGVTSPFVWRSTPDAGADPSGLLWWLLVAHDGATAEGSWGTDDAGIERQGPAPGGSSGVCGTTTKVVTNPCGQ